MLKNGQEVIQNMSHAKISDKDKNSRGSGTEINLETSEDRRKEPAVPEAPEEEKRGPKGIGTQTQH